MNDLNRMAQQAVDLSGKGEPADTIDLTKTVTDQDFRKGSLSLLGSIAESSATTIYHLERALPLLVQMVDSIATEIAALNKRLDGLEVIDVPEGDGTDGEQEQDAPAGEAAQEAQDTVATDFQIAKEQIEEDGRRVGVDD